MKIKREILHIDKEKCDGCGKCIRSCVEGALRITNSAVYLVAGKYCDGCGACIWKCPLGALKIAEHDADEFQELVQVRC
jgi:ferredoxin